MSRRGENIYKRKDGRWEGRYIRGHSNGKAQYGYVFAKTYGEVKYKLSSAKKMIQNMNSKEAKTQAYGGNFCEIAQAWMETQRMQLKQSSVVKYANILNSYLFPVFAKIDITKISRNDVSIFKTALLSSGGKNNEGLSPKTVSNILSVMKNIFDYEPFVNERLERIKL